MNRDDIIRMAREVGFSEYHLRVLDQGIYRLADLVAAAEREKVAKWMIQHSYATGHGDTIEDLIAELDWQIAENWNRAMMNGIETEREACAKVCEEWLHGEWHNQGVVAACMIRARGQE